MEFAHFSHIWGKPGMTPGERYDQLWREVMLSDEMGYEYGFCVEHHFRPDESWMSSPALYAVGAGARTKSMRFGAMGFLVPLHHPARLVEEIAIVDQMLGGRLEVGLVPGITPDPFPHFGLDYQMRKPVTLEFVHYMRAAYGKQQPYSFQGEHHKTAGAILSVQPVQKPHPPLWMQSRDPETLEFCAVQGINTGYFISFPREEAASRYRKYLDDWAKANHKAKPKIGYSTVVYVDETDEKAMETALKRASRAYVGFLRPPNSGQSFDDRVADLSARFQARGELGAAEIMGNIFNPDYLAENDLAFIGSPDTVAEKLRVAAEKGFFNVFMGEFNFADLPEENLMRSIRLFGEEVIPQLRDFEPF
ncbi:MAG: LLM class flavin-dependent oxidoreductase [Pseudomonadota bacterium]|nr:LLM class flavin-dependent oxidoreductase [Pseudomonadota bacterium]